MNCPVGIYEAVNVSRAWNEAFCTLRLWLNNKDASLGELIWIECRHLVIAGLC